MRNLKRALSLALAAVMVIGMMVIGAGAVSFNDFPDKGEIKNQDAVSLLSTLGIINGKDSGKFDPTGNVTRAEMAKMISVVLNSGADNNALYADMNTKLTDTASSWAKGHINFCYSRNIITGRGNNTFDPTANVTAAEAAKMLLVAAGYDPAIEGFTGGNWSINVSAKASALGIFKNFENGKLMQPLSRDDAALLIYNAMDVEMIEKYENGYALVHKDYRTILSTMYGVYKIEGVVVSNEWAALNESTYDVALSKEKTTLDNIKVYKSTTSNTSNTEYEVEKLPQTFKVSTDVDMLGKTVTMYVRKTTVLSNSEVLGVYVKDSANTVKNVTDTQDTMKDALKGSGISTDKDTEYYVNYGYMASEKDATKAMGFETATAGDRFTSLNTKTNGYGVNMDVIDNDGDGVAEYVLYTQETLTQVTSLNATKEKTTLNGFNKNGSIDNEDIVAADEYKEGDLVLANEYGGRYYVSIPEVVTGNMDSFSSNKTNQQYIEINGEKKYPSYIQFKADAADNTNLFNVLQCGTTDGVDFDISYDFVLDTLGNVIAYLPSEKGVGNYALILDSGYDPGRTSSNPTGEVKVLLADGTEASYTLNFSGSASNIGKQLFPTANSTTQKDAGIIELKAFLGSAVQDNTTTKPDSAVMSGITFNYAGNSNAALYKAGHAKGYVVEYGMNDEKILTIKSIVGSNNTGATHYNPENNIVTSKLDEKYENGSSRVKYTDKTNAKVQVAIDQNTVAFYYLPASGSVSAKYGVAVGYSKMSNVDQTTAFVTKTAKNSNLANTILFNAEGVAAEKDYVYVLGRTTSIAGYVTLNVIMADGTASTLKVERDHFDSIFGGSSDYNTAYSYTTNGKGVSELSTNGSHAKYGYALKLNNGTVALYSDKTCKTLIDTYSYDKNVWNVEDVSAGDNAPGGSFSTTSAKETILVLDSKENVVRAAYIKSTVDGTIDNGAVGSLNDGVISTNNTKIIFDISKNTITLTNAMAASSTTAISGLTATVLANTFTASTGNTVMGMYNYSALLNSYTLVANPDTTVVTTSMVLGVKTATGMTYYTIKFASATAPVITTNLPAKGEMGKALSVTVAPFATGEGNPTYQWYKVASPADTAIAGATGASYTPASPIVNGDKIYVVVTKTVNSVTSTTKSAICEISTLTHAATVAFTTDLGPTATLGDTLTVTAAKTPASDAKDVLTYQWYTAADGVTAGAAIPGATNSTYKPTATGKYLVIATVTNNDATGNKTNTATSSICTVSDKTYTVNGAGTYTAGQSVTITTGVTNGSSYRLTYTGSTTDLTEIPVKATSAGITFTMPAADVTLTEVFMVRIPAAVTNSKVGTTDGLYTITQAVGSTPVAAGSTVYLAAAETLTVTMTWTGTTITGTKDTITVAAGGATPGAAVDFTAGAWTDVVGNTKTTTIGTWTAGSEVTYTGAHT